MKNNILSFLLGVMCVLFIAASSDTFQIVQPKKPTITEVKSFRSMMGLESDIRQYIEQKVKDGYIVKSVAMMDDETWSKAIVVVEKY
jgi:hypothetical protein